MNKTSQPVLIPPSSFLLPPSASGAWGLRGCTMIRLGDADEATVRQALGAAWRNTAPKRLVQDYDED